jgi:mannosyltransferase
VGNRATTTSRSTPAWTVGPLTSGRRLATSRSAEIVVGLTAVAAALRFGTLDVQSAWLDEAATFDLVHRGLSGMLSHLSVSESSPPLYYVLVWAWTKVFGGGVFAVRSFSALVGTLTVPVLYAAGRRISPRVGLWAAALATVNPAMYYYSQESRSYALLILLSAAAFLFWQRALAEPTARSLAGWAAMSILALLTHYFAAFLFVAEAALLVRRYGARRVRAPVGVVVLAGLALLPLAVSERSSGQASWIEGSSLLSRAAEAPKQFLVGLYGPAETLTAVLAALLSAVAIAVVVFLADRRERGLARDVALVGAVALALPLLLSVSHLVDVFDGRNVIGVWIPWAILLAIGVGGAGAPRLGPLLGIALCLVSVAVIVGIDATPGYQRDDWRGVAEALPQQAHGSVVVTPANGLLPLGVYLPGLRKATEASVSTRELEFVALRVKRTGRSPSGAVVSITPPRGFHLAQVRRTEAYAVVRFVASREVPTSAALLRGMTAAEGAEVLIRR